MPATAFQLLTERGIVPLVDAGENFSRNSCCKLYIVDNPNAQSKALLSRLWLVYFMRLQSRPVKLNAVPGRVGGLHDPVFKRRRILDEALQAEAVHLQE